MKTQKLITITCLTFVLTACGMKFELPEALTAKPGVLKLSSQQLKAVQDSVKQIIPNPESANFGKPKALRRLKGKKEIQVCGYVRYTGADGKRSGDTLYFMEFKPAPNENEIGRGQIGSDQPKLSKVKFMCRMHL